MTYRITLLAEYTKFDEEKSRDEIEREIANIISESSIEADNNIV